MRARATLLAALTTAALFAESEAVRAEPACSAAAFPSLPDVRIVSVSAETDLAPHCKVAGVIGAETNFELLLPDKWNGKFVMGGGGGFVGSVVNIGPSILVPASELAFSTKATGGRDEARTISQRSRSSGF